jgi:hypothetical protein
MVLVLQYVVHLAAAGTVPYKKRFSEDEVEMDDGPGTACLYCSTSLQDNHKTSQGLHCFVDHTAMG